MKLLLAVAADLWSFAVEALFGRRAATTTPVAVGSVITVERPPLPLALPAAVEVPPLRPAAPLMMPPAPAPTRPPAPKAVSTPPRQPPAALPGAPEEPQPEMVRRNTIVYVAVPRARFRTAPARDADNVLMRVPYGAMVMAIESNDEWVRAYYRGTEGWVSADEVATKAAAVYPRFVAGEPNPAESENTRLTRAVIDDEFAYEERGLPLAGEEYIFFKLVKRGTAVAWPDTRPRLPGMWAEIFRNDSGQVTESAEPVERSVMEWRHGTGAGHLAYVEAVHDDGSIRISEADWPRDGIYNERVLLKEEWQELQPTFLVFG